MTGSKPKRPPVTAPKGKPEGVSAFTWRLALVLAEIALGRRHAGRVGKD